MPNLFLESTPQPTPQPQQQPGVSTQPQPVPQQQPGNLFLRSQPPSQAPRPAQPSSGPWTRDRVRNEVRASAIRYGVNPDVAERLAMQESSMNPDARGPVTRFGWQAIGPMQLSPDTAKSLGIDPYDPGQNIDGGMRHFSHLLQRYGGNYQLALAAFNAGENAVDNQHAQFWSDVQSYTRNILGGAYRGIQSAEKFVAHQARIFPQVAGEIASHPARSAQAIGAGLTFGTIVKPPKATNEVEAAANIYLDLAGQIPWFLATDGLADAAVAGLRAGRLAELVPGAARVAGFLGPRGTAAATRGARLFGSGAAFGTIEAAATGKPVGRTALETGLGFLGFGTVGELLSSKLFGPVFRRMSAAWGVEPKKIGTQFAESVGRRSGEPEGMVTGRVGSAGSIEEQIAAGLPGLEPRLGQPGPGEASIGVRGWHPPTPDEIRSRLKGTPTSISWATDNHPRALEVTAARDAASAIDQATHTGPDLAASTGEAQDLYRVGTRVRYEGEFALRGDWKAFSKDFWDNLRRAAPKLGEKMENFLRSAKGGKVLRQLLEGETPEGWDKLPNPVRAILLDMGKAARAWDDETFQIGRGHGLFTNEDYLQDHLLHSVREATPGDPLYNPTAAAQARELVRNFRLAQDPSISTPPTTWARSLKTFDQFAAVVKAAGLTPVTDPLQMLFLGRAQVTHSIIRRNIVKTLQNVVEPFARTGPGSPERGIWDRPIEGGPLPSGYKAPEFGHVVGLKGLYFPNKIADAIDIIGERLAGAPARPSNFWTMLDDAATLTNGLVRRAIVLLPFRHALNIMTRAATSVGFIRGVARPLIATIPWVGSGIERAIFPRMGETFGGLVHDAMTDGSISRLALASGVRYDYKSVARIYHETTEWMVRNAFEHDPDTVAATLTKGQRAALKAAKDQGGFAGGYDPVRLRAQWAADAASTKMAEMATSRNPLDIARSWPARLYNKSQEWLWEKLDKGLRNQVFLGKLHELLGEDAVRDLLRKGEEDILTHEELADEVRRALADKRFKSSVFGIQEVHGASPRGSGDSSRVGQIEGKTIRLEDIGEWTNKVMTDYSRELQTLKLDQYGQKLGLFWTWQRGIWDYYGHMVKHIKDTGPEGAWSRQALARAAVATFVVFPAMGMYVAAKLTGKPFSLETLRPQFTGAPTVGQMDQTKIDPTKKHPFSMETRDIKESTPGGLGEPVEVASRVAAIFGLGPHANDPRGRLAPIETYVENRLQPITRGFLTWGVGAGTDPVTGRHYVKKGQDFIAFISDIMKYGAEHMSGIFSAWSSNDTQALKFLRFMGAPMYTAKHRLKSNNEILLESLTNPGQATRDEADAIRHGRRPITPGERRKFYRQRYGLH